MESANQFITRTRRKFKKEYDKYTREPKDSRLKWLPDINRRGRYGTLREKWTLMKQYNIDGKILIVERFKLMKIKQPSSHPKLKVGDIEYRFGYYMLGMNGNRRNMWTWGESCPIIPKRDFDKLIKKARREKTIG